MSLVRSLMMCRPSLTKCYSHWLGGLHVISLRNNLRSFSRITKISTRKPGSGSVLPVFKMAEDWHWRCALIDQYGPHTYKQLLERSTHLSLKILKACEANGYDLNETSVSILCPNDASYVVSNWAVWMTGATLVPLCLAHPASELQYYVEDSQSKLLITTHHYENTAHTISKNTNIPHIILNDDDYSSSFDASKVNSGGAVAVDFFKKKLDGLVNSRYFQRRNAMIIYTSGTTGKPKGVVLTHANLHAQAQMMRVSWAWTHQDVLLHCLPLHHIHGAINMLLTPLMSGATCVMLPKFDAKQVWTKLVEPIQISEDTSINVNMFMAVPTIYVKLIQYFKQNWGRGRGSRQAKEHIKSVCKSKIRLMVSGSSALPEPVMTKWDEITGHRILERYGMTELGMVLTNPLEAERIPGAVGNPFPGVEVCLARTNVYSPDGYDVIARGNSQSTKETPGFEGESGELYVKGPGVFKYYYNKPEATKASFTKDGWFKTGDTLCYVNGVYKILGRTSVDIIKSGGYKISALDVERHLMAHPDIIECCVVGLPDLTWGQRVAAVVVLHDDVTLTLEELRSWSDDKMPHYHIPTVLKELPEMPRNAMGKINKKTIIESVFPEYLAEPDQTEK